MPSVDPNYMLANAQLCPAENCPKSYRELGDSRWKGMLLLNDPSASSTGSFVLGYLYEQYGEELIKGIIANTRALTRSNIDQERQVARGEYALSVMGKAPEATWKLPEPRPVRIILPTDGMIPTIGGLNLLKGAPHPNAARVFINFQFTEAGQQARASVFGGTFVRKGVTPAEPAIIQMGDKWFPKFSLADTQAYTVRYVKYTPIYDKYLKEFGLK
jgi:iron(III) transport system substrate-binding protein